MGVGVGVYLYIFIIKFDIEYKKCKWGVVVFYMYCKMARCEMGSVMGVLF